MTTETTICAEAAFIAECLNTESAAVSRVAASMGRTYEQWRLALDTLERCTGHVVVSGMGKSGLVGAKVSATLASLGQPSHVVHPAEAVHGDLGRVRRGDCALLLSYSGETEELVNLALLLKADGVSRVGISCNANSSLARACDGHIELGDIVEACPLNLAPTASTTAMIAVGDALALALAQRRNFKADDFHKHHPGGMLGAGLRSITEALRFRVGENLPVVSDTATVEVALESTSDGRRAGAILLVDANGRLSGIFTDGDLRRLVRTRGAQALVAPIASVMSARPISLPVDSLVRDAVRLMRERRLDEVPVVDGDGRPVGLVDVQDLVALRVVQD